MADNKKILSEAAECCLLLRRTHTVGIYGSNSGISDVYVGRCRASYDVIIRGASLRHPRVHRFIADLKM